MKIKKRVLFLKRFFLSFLVVLGTLSIAYLGFAFIAFAALLDNGGTGDIGDILEWMRNPYFTGIIIVSSILLGFLKKTRKRLKNRIADLAENFFSD